MALWGKQDAAAPTGSGTVSVTNASTAVTGSGTTFLADLDIGDVLIITSGTTTKNRVTAIASNTALTLADNFTGTTAASLAIANVKIQQQPKSSYQDSNAPKRKAALELVYGVNTTESVAGGDNITAVSVASGAARYLEVPSVTIAAPVSLTILTTAVSTTASTITSANHKLLTGTKLTYLQVGATAITGLANATAYFAIVVDSNTFKLASSLVDAQAGTAISLTGAGSSTQTFTGDTATATAAISGGAVSAITVTDVGSAYLTAPAVTVAKPRRVIPTGSVTIDTEQIDYATHGLVAADEVKYYHANGTAITGLTNATSYFVSALGLAAGTFRLATTAVIAAGRTALAGVAISGTAGEFTCTATTLAVGDHVVLGGTITGAGATGSITSHTAGKIYEVSAITGTSPSVTGFTLTQEDTTALVTTAGNGTGLTYTPFTIVLISGTGNSAQYFEIQATADQATATAALGDGAVGGSAHAGWVRRTVGTGGRAGRVQYETLVAMGSMTGDASDDTVLPDA
jgi:hypothetical protein